MRCLRIDRRVTLDLFAVPKFFYSRVIISCIYETIYHVSEQYNLGFMAICDLWYTELEFAID